MPLIYHYLQFAYFKEKDMDKSASCVASYQLLRPDDEDMTHNKEFYLKESHAEEEMFKPRAEAAAYAARDAREKALLDFVDVGFDLDREDREALNVLIEAFNPEVRIKALFHSWNESHCS